MDLKLAETAIKTLLRAIGDPYPSLKVTPSRAARGLAELLDGYLVDINSLFTATEEGEGKDQLVILKDIEFTSICLHHLLPFRGLIHIGYLPQDRVIGLSKLGRLALAYSRRLQLQEKLTKEIAYCLMKKLKPRGVAVVIVAEHSCIQSRGIKLSGSNCITSEMLGKFRVEPILRQEFLSLIALDRVM